MCKVRGKVLTITLPIEEIENNKKKQKESEWVKKAWDHDEKGQYAKLKQYRRDNVSLFLFYDYLRMMPEEFDEVHGLVKETIERRYVVRKPICSEERLAVTLKQARKKKIYRLIIRTFLTENFSVYYMRNVFRSKLFLSVTSVQFEIVHDISFFFISFVFDLFYLYFSTVRSTVSAID